MLSNYNTPIFWSLFGAMGTQEFEVRFEVISMIGEN